MRELSLKERAYPTDLNHKGGVFGGWIMAKMDKAASIAVENAIYAKAVTVSVSNINFKHPIQNGDIVTVYTEISKIGRTSMTIHVEVVVDCQKTRSQYCVTDANFIFVALDEMDQPTEVRNVMFDDMKTKLSNLL